MPSALPGLLRTIFRLKDRNSLRSDSQPSIRLKTALRFTPLLWGRTCLRKGTASHKYRCWLC